MSEALLYIDRKSSIRPEHPRDGDVLVVVQDYDIRRVWAEMIVQGKVHVPCPADLRKAYLAITDDLSRMPKADDLADWWVQAEKEAAALGFDVRTFAYWPWGKIERMNHLAVPVGTWLTDALSASFVRPQVRTDIDANGVATVRIVQFRTAWLDWRAKLAGKPDLVARILDPSTEVDFAAEALPEAAAADVAIRKDL